ncbi:MAG: type I-B CRISPR-associated protein Cas7/Cst2/DevR [Cytophagia bacterium]|nr:MAG: type I-B CRISPR-associated protein Cas7/Cst2/DevR [Cytophagales bacterium]TAG39143.1 MAG: type I-B CRISPR-associated protein Cas7/Cst2/DevR [Cytophagia bacterium]TAG80789.1 MAG: type I-B CRISPR-associated protein Cas7/Cst2/DevR [Cytophagales bacterium]
MTRKANSLTITYLTKVTFASLNGGDSDADNINAIKKVTFPDGSQVPYMSSQSIRYGIRKKLEEFGETLSPIGAGEDKKGTAKGGLNPTNYIDDDLMGFMYAVSGGTIPPRASPVRVDALVALSEYKDDLDFGTNFQKKEAGVGEANIFETEIHSGVYRGTILIELDRVGVFNEDKKEQKEIANAEKARRVLKFLESFRMLWTPGRQTRFLSDISPKFMAAALMTSKNPIFLEAIDVDKKDQKVVKMDSLKNVVADYQPYIQDHLFAVQEGIFQKQEGMVSLAEGFGTIEDWVKAYYKD